MAGADGSTAREFPCGRARRRAGSADERRSPRACWRGSGFRPRPAARCGFEPLLLLGDHRHSRHQRARIGMRGRLEQRRAPDRSRRAGRDRARRRGSRRFRIRREIVRDEDIGEAETGSRVRSSSSMILACTETSSAEVGSSSTMQLRLDRDRARDRDALLLAAREFVRVAVGEMRRAVAPVRAARATRLAISRRASRAPPAAPRSTGRSSGAD